MAASAAAQQELDQLMRSEARRQFNQLRSDAEGILRYQPSKGTVVLQLAISVCLGVFFAAWRATSWVLAAGVPLGAVAFFFLDAYQRTRLRRIMALMQFALDLDFAGDLR